MNERLICPHCRKRFDADPETNPRCPKCGMRSTADEFRVASIPPKIRAERPSIPVRNVVVTVTLLAIVLGGFAWVAFHSEDTPVIEQASAEERLDAFYQSAAEEGIVGLVDRAEVNGDTLTIAVVDQWHRFPYQERLQAAQNLWATWADVNTPGSLDLSRLKLTDRNGNAVGGSRAFGGSMIWVQE